MKFKRFLALTISTAMTLSLIPVYPAADMISEEVETEEAAEISGDRASVGEIIKTDANAGGEYTVTVTGENLIYDERLAGVIPAIVTAEEVSIAEKMSRGDFDFEFGGADVFIDDIPVEGGEDFAGEEPVFWIDDDNGIGLWSYDEAAYDDDIGLWSYDEAAYDDGTGFWSYDDISYDDIAGLWSYDEISYDDGTGSWTYDDSANEGGTADETQSENDSDAGTEGENPVKADSDIELADKDTSQTVSGAEAADEKLPEPGSEAPEADGFDQADGSGEAGGFADESKWKLSDVSMDDVSVFFKIARSVDGKDKPAYVTYAARVTDFVKNDDDSISISFIGAGEDIGSIMYTIRFAGGPYALVMAYSDVSGDAAEDGGQDAEESGADGEAEFAESGAADEAEFAESGAADEAEFAGDGADGEVEFKESGTDAEAEFTESGESGEEESAESEAAGESDALESDVISEAEDMEIETDSELNSQAIEVYIDNGGMTTGEFIEVEANESGTYTVVIKKENILTDQIVAEMVPEIVTAGESILAEGMTRGDLDIVDDAGELPALDDGIIDIEGGSFDEENLIEESSAAESGAWSVSEVSMDDISVCYNVPQPVEEGEDPRYTTLKAEITGFRINDDGNIELSFEGRIEDALSCMYTVRFAGTDAYAVVQAFPADNGVVIKDIDYGEEENKTVGAAGLSFDEDDVVLPEGTYVYDGELIVSDDAPEVVQEMLLDTGIGEEEMSRANDDDDDDDDDPNVPDLWMIEEDKRQREEQGNDTPAPVGDGNAAGNNGNAGGNNGNAGSGSGSSSSGGTSNATLEYIQQYNERQKAFQNYDALAEYTPEILSYINPTAGKVSKFGSDVYRIFKGVYNNNWGSGIQGTLGVLKMFGLFKNAGSPGVSNADILSEVQKVGLEVSDMHSLTKVMNETANITLSELYKERIKDFDTAIIALNANAEIAQKMLTQGTIVAYERGINVPGEDATADEEFEFNYDLIELILDIEKNGGAAARPFRGFSKYMDAVEDNFILVAGEVAQAADFNPVTAYDAYWNMYFNYDTQGYYLRQSYRSNIEYELKRGFCLLEIYRNIFAPDSMGNYTNLNNMLIKALDQLASMSPGTRPEEVMKKDLWGHPEDWFNKAVYCNSFKKKITGITVQNSAVGNEIASGVMEEYVRRLHGRTVDEDLKLAGMWRNSTNCGWGLKWGGGGNYDNDAHGIGLNAKKDGKTNKADIIAFDGSIHKGQTTYNQCKTFKTFDSSSTWRMPYIWFNFG